MKELPKRFDFLSIDEKWCRYWEENKTFSAKANPDKEPYTIVIPPPNVTGILHMGHALNNTLQDIIIRYKRMQGFETLWMPGTDHAGIATQNVVEKQLAKEGKTRQEVGREAFLERLWSWKKEYGDTIIHQLKKLGSSCDWERTRFTMDEGYSEAVKTVFIKLYEKGLIYQGERIINWCPRCHTALSDEEAEHQEVQGHLYHIKYPYKDDPEKHIIVATTRPETMLGDTAVAVNPNDARYKDLIGKKVVLPLTGREIEIVADGFVDTEFGTGAVKVTPAHDPNDFEIGKRHGLEFLNVMHPDGRINKLGGKFNELDRFEARKLIVKELKELGLLVRIDTHSHAVGHCYRCSTVVEPYLSKQWFVKMEPLAKPAIEAVESGKIKIHPQRWNKVYMNWMENIRDWCISRQIWWGHRIPVWYCQDCSEIIASAGTPSKCPKCKSADLKQDPDVMDTWFSSWLWPFATLDWPNENEDLKYFYPTSSLFTAPEIIFFWVARMIMAGIEFMGDVPFSDVYLHGTVRDAKGRKMSKSLGNALDPLEIINEYGADALRFSLIMNSGQDLFISKEKFEIGRNFANKIWNASRLILMNAKDIDPDLDLGDPEIYETVALPTRWIIAKYFETVGLVGSAIEGYKYSEAESHIYDFFWNNFCDWYLEIIKDQWENRTVQNVAVKILENSLKFIHPFMPFVTEEIWSIIKEGEAPISVQKWPNIVEITSSAATLSSMKTIVDVVVSIRNIRSQWKINPKEQIECVLVTTSGETVSLLDENASMIKALAKVGTLSITDELASTKNTAAAVVENIKCIVPLGSLIDIDQEKKRTQAQIEQQKKASSNISNRLNNEQFVNNAPGEVIEKEKARLETIDLNIKELEEILGSLE